MHAIVHFIATHPTQFSVAGFWLFSGLCSTMPPLKEPAGYWATWAHNFIQLIAANSNKFKIPKENP